MNATVTIKAAEGLKICDPRTGQQVPCDRFVNKPKINFWLKRIKDGSVITKTDKPAKPKKRVSKSQSKSGDKQ
jgi:hypothetical protein